MKLLCRLLLSLFFVALGVNAYPYMNMEQGAYGTASLLTLQRQAARQDVSIPVIQTPQAATEKVSYRLKATQIEDDDDGSEEVSLKKCLGISDYLSTFFYTSTSTNYKHSIKACASFCKHFSFFSKCRYIIFRVIRV